jgi:hypothetical protein
MVDGIEVLVVLVEVWSTSSPTCNGMIGGADALSLLSAISAGKGKEEVGNALDAFSRACWMLEGDWKMKSFWSGLALPEYLPRLSV